LKGKKKNLKKKKRGEASRELVLLAGVANYFLKAGAKGRKVKEEAQKKGTQLKNSGVEESAKARTGLPRYRQQGTGT